MLPGFAVVAAMAQAERPLNQGTGMVTRMRRVNTARLLSSASCQMRNVVRAVALPESD